MRLEGDDGKRGGEDKGGEESDKGPGPAQPSPAKPLGAVCREQLEAYLLP
jgi:hypothetical protein